jgi:hypothetical protein
MLELWRFNKPGPFQGKRIEFGACQYENDERKFQGRPHDLKGFDEITQFTESQYKFLITWNRSTIPGQRVRVVATGNPPVSAEGRWVIDHWGPWLNPAHTNPAKQGELRWFVTSGDGKDIEVPDHNPVLIKYDDGTEDWTYPKSRTFIRARVEDNPRLMETGYRRTLQNLPEPLRSRMLRGDFGVGHEDDEWQIIPSDWVLAAQARWAPTFEEFLVKREKARLLREGEGVQKEDAKSPPSDVFAQHPSSGPALSRGDDLGAIPESLKGFSGIASISGYTGDSRVAGAHNNIGNDSGRGDPGNTALEPGLGRIQEVLSKDEIAKRKAAAQEAGCIGIDVSRGGRHSTIIAERLEQWFATLIEIPGKQTKDGNEVVQTLISLGFQKRRIHIDVTGVGTSPVDIGKMYDMNIVPMVGSETKNIGHIKDKSGKLGFLNARALWWWKFREALDPTLGDGIALPPDPGLLGDLTSPRWMLSARGIQVEQKEHIKDRLGRSPDKGDAVVMAYSTPYMVAAAYLEFMKEQVEEEKQRQKQEQGQGQGLRPATSPHLHNQGERL